MSDKSIRTLVATKVLGWEFIKEGLYKDNSDNQVFFNPEKDMNDAWLVIEKMKGEDYLFSLKNIVKGTFTFSLTDWGGNCSTYVAEAATAPLAICLATLKAVETDIK